MAQPDNFFGVHPRRRASVTSEGPKPDRKVVQLLEERGETSRFIDAEIIENGDLVVSAQDVGEAPLQWWGDSDYEFWVTVASKDKPFVLQALIEFSNQAGGLPPIESKDQDKALLVLLERTYAGHFGAVDEFRDFLKSRDIPFSGGTWA